MCTRSSRVRYTDSGAQVQDSSPVEYQMAIHIFTFRRIANDRRHAEHVHGAPRTEMQGVHGVCAFVFTRVCNVTDDLFERIQKSSGTQGFFGVGQRLRRQCRFTGVGRRVLFNPEIRALNTIDISSSKGGPSRCYRYRTAG